MKRSAMLALTGASVAAGFPLGARAQTEPAKIRIGSSRTDTFGAGFYATDGGFFKAAGIDVELLTFSNGAAVAAACAGGSLDVGIGEVTELANGVAHGLPFALIAGAGLFATDAPTTMLCVAKDSPIKRPHDLEGKTIAVPVLVSLSAISVKLWLVKNGVDLNKVRFTEISTAAMPAGLEHGTVDAAHIGEPGLTIGGAQVRPIATPYSAIARQFLISDWFTTRDWIAKNPDLAKRVVTVAYQTARWANGHQDLTAPIIAKYAGLDLERARTMRRTRFATTLDAGLVQPILDAAAQFGGLSRPMKADELIAKV
jgi:NitT/TauT family transport system substrate-binding protein